MIDKPRVRQLPQACDSVMYRVTYRGISKTCRVSGFAAAFNLIGEAEHQINRLITQIERELA